MTVSQDSHETLLREDPKLLTVLLNCHNCHFCLLSSSLVLLPADTPDQPKDNRMTHKTDTVLHPRIFKPDHLRAGSTYPKASGHDPSNGRRAGSSDAVVHARVTARPELAR